MSERADLLNVGQPHRLSGRPWSCFVMDGGTVVAVRWGLTAKAARRRAERECSLRSMIRTASNGER